MKISLVITNYNTWPLVYRCVEAAIKMDQFKLIEEIIIIDDCSTEGTPTHIKHNTAIKIIRNKENLGYAKSVNIGISNASSELILLLDSDAFIQTDINLVNSFFLDNPDVGLAGFKIIKSDGIETGASEPMPGVMSYLLGQAIYEKYRKAFPFLLDKKIALFSFALAIRKALVVELQGFDESFDFLDADIDFSYRAYFSKWKIKMIKNFIVQHDGGGSPQLTSKRVIRYYKNRLLFLKKHRLIKFSFLLKLGVIGRLSMEYLIFSSRLLINGSNPIILDKIYSRKYLIKSLLVK